MKKNKCIRCEKLERFGRVFESVEFESNVFYLCVECAQLLYKASDARKVSEAEKATMLYNDFKQGIINESEKPILTDWLAKLTQ